MVRLSLALEAAVLIIGTAVMAQHGRDEPHQDYLACADKRIMTFGSRQRAEPVAEMVALARRMDEASTLGEGYSNWALATSLGCNAIPSTTRNSFSGLAKQKRARRRSHLMKCKNRCRKRPN